MSADLSAWHRRRLREAAAHLAEAQRHLALALEGRDPETRLRYVSAHADCAREVAHVVAQTLDRRRAA